MKVRFWGTRGSIPQSIRNEDFAKITQDLIQKAREKGLKTIDEFEKAFVGHQLNYPVVYGGNTTCTEVVSNKQSFFVDLGTGIREAGTHALQDGTKEFHIFLTHMHWDHIMGLPFFIPVHMKDHVVKIYYVHKNAPEHVKIIFNGVNFPLQWSQLNGTIEFIPMKLYEATEIAGTKITPFVLDHPGGCFGFRFDHASGSVAIGVDGEYKRLSRKDLGKDLKFYQNLDLLVFDSQYEMAELVNRFDWGHCSPNIGVNLAVREGIRALAFTHHDPWSDNAKLRRMFSNATGHLKEILPDHHDVWKDKRPEGPHLFMAYDGLTIDTTKLVP